MQFIAAPNSDVLKSAAVLLVPLVALMARASSSETDTQPEATASIPATSLPSALVPIIVPSEQPRLNPSPTSTPRPSPTPTLTPTATVTPIPTPTSIPLPASWTFEDSTLRGWYLTGPAATMVNNTTSDSYESSHSLQLNLFQLSNSNDGLAQIAAPTDRVPGGSIEAWVFAPSAGTAAHIFVQERDRKWYQIHAYAPSLPAGGWTKLQLTVPNYAIEPLQMIGVKFTATNPWTGTVYIDAVGYGSVFP